MRRGRGHARGHGSRPAIDGRPGRRDDALMLVVIRLLGTQAVGSAFDLSVVLMLGEVVDEVI
jgi:hypothetical protein